MTHTGTANAAMENAGSLVGRPDLGDDAIVDALSARLRSVGSTQTDARTVLSAAQGGDKDALKILRTIDLPAPVAHLQMPLQVLKAEPRKKSLNWSFGRFTVTRRA